MKMKRLGLTCTIACALALAFAGSQASAISVTLHSSNSGIGTCTFSVSGTVITITENWTGSGPGVLEISGLTLNTVYTIRKVITNNSGDLWTRFANELLDPAGQTNDGIDPKPYPIFVPAGFTTSNDSDGLSFAQGSTNPQKLSSVWSTVTVDELTDARDFIDFSNGTLASGSTDNYMQFGLLDQTTGNEPFLLMQRPNATSTSVPDLGSTGVLFGLSLLGIARFLRRTA